MDVNSQFVFHSKAIAEEPVKRCSRPPAPNLRLTKEHDYQKVLPGAQGLFVDLRGCSSFLVDEPALCSTGAGWDMRSLSGAERFGTASKSSFPLGHRLSRIPMKPALPYRLSQRFGSFSAVKQLLHLGVLGQTRGIMISGSF